MIRMPRPQAFSLIVQQPVQRRDTGSPSPETGGQDRQASHAPPHNHQPRPIGLHLQAFGNFDSAAERKDRVLARQAECGADIGRLDD